jgi:phosphoglycerate dehydrogenase-like enzyme
LIRKYISPANEEKNLNVHILNKPDPEAYQRLRSHLLPEIQPSFGRQLPDPATFDVLVAGQPTHQQLTASPKLSTLVIPLAGLSDATRQVLQDFPGLTVYNLHHNASLTAEMALALLLAAAKFIVPSDQALRRNDWRPHYLPLPALSLYGKTALILGFGNVGRRIGAACAALGMRVVAIRRHPERTITLDYPAEIHGLEALTGLLPQTEAIIIALPGTPETYGLLGATEIALLPPGAILVNVGRGPIVDQHALFQALKDGHLRAAGLDVWYNYPSSEAERESTPPADEPFHLLENVVLSPHRADGSSETEILRMEGLAEVLNALARGEEPPNRVDLALGY